MLIMLSYNYRRTMGKISTYLASESAPSSKFITHLLAVLNGAEQFDVKHVKETVSYFLLPKPSSASWAICCIFRV
jgi:hypothetical protein